MATLITETAPQYRVRPARGNEIGELQNIDLASATLFRGTGLDLVYARDGASLAGYKRVLLRPVSVAFRRDWGRDPLVGSRIRSEDSGRIKADLARIMVRERPAG